jgi:hypothetical protein
MGIAERWMSECIDQANKKKVTFTFGFHPQREYVYSFSACSSVGEKLQFYTTLLSHGFALLKKFIELSTEPLGRPYGQGRPKAEAPDDWECPLCQCSEGKCTC